MISCQYAVIGAIGLIPAKCRTSGHCADRYFGPYEAVALEAATGLPIEEVVITVEWEKKRLGGPGGSVSSVARTRQFKTDQEGRIVIERYPLLKDPFILSLRSASARMDTFR